MRLKMFWEKKVCVDLIRLSVLILNNFPIYRPCSAIYNNLFALVV